MSLIFTTVASACFFSFSTIISCIFCLFFGSKRNQWRTIFSSTSVEKERSGKADAILMAWNPKELLR